MKIPPCSFIRACLFIKIQEFFHPACLLEPARLLGRQEYISNLGEGQRTNWPDIASGEIQN